MLIDSADSAVPRTRWKVLKQRVLTASVLIPLVVLATLYLPAGHYAALLAVFIGLGAWEWAGLCGYPAFGKVTFVTLVLMLLSGCFLSRHTVLSAILINLASIWWLAATALMISQQRRQQLSLGGRHVKAAVGILVLVPAWLSLVMLHGVREGRVYVIFLLALIWLADGAAYFCGHRWGKTKLAGIISPGKTWEGVLGALLASTLVSALFALATGIRAADIIMFSIICVITVMGSIVGDLIESLLKRLAQVKDSGSVFPGHGGVLDRIDSLTAAAPVFLTGLWLLQRSAE